VIVRADDGFCRDKVGAPVQAVRVEGTSALVFLGAGGHAVEVEARKDTYILDSGLDAGLELPFTCRGGICGACVGRVAEGEVDQSDVSHRK
jgi:ferredoxin